MAQRVIIYVTMTIKTKQVLSYGILMFDPTAVYSCYSVIDLGGSQTFEIYCINRVSFLSDGYYIFDIQLAVLL